MFWDKDPQYAIIISLIWKILCDKNCLKNCHFNLSGVKNALNNKLKVFIHESKSEFVAFVEISIQKCVFVN